MASELEKWAKEKSEQFAADHSLFHGEVKAWRSGGIHGALRLLRVAEEWCEIGSGSGFCWNRYEYAEKLLEYLKNYCHRDTGEAK